MTDAKAFFLDMVHSDSCMTNSRLKDAYGVIAPEASVALWTLAVVKKYVTEQKQHMGR